VARRNVGTANTITPCTALASAGHSASEDGGAVEVVTLGAANTLLAAATMCSPFRSTTAA
jgi:hypothetical protein